MDQEKIARGVHLILEGIGENPEREGLKETPRRLAEMYEEILGGIHQKPGLEAGFSEEVGDDMILIKAIPFYSMCEHHLLPFFGKVHLAYIPRDNKVAGFSSFTRLVDVFSRRLQIQERLTHQIAEEIMKNLNPRGVLVVVEAQQLCVSMRGSKKDAVRTVTQAVRGEISLERMQINHLFHE
ncbi:MAG: GTP cyclohydrolase I FolE [Calditrichia bacterium]